MEILIVIAVLILLALILGVDILMVGTVIIGVLTLATLAITFFFLLNLLRLLTTRPTRGKLLGLREHEKFKYPWAFYEIDGQEYRNVFPCEVILRDRLYPEGKLCTLWTNRKKGWVYDTNAFICVLVGTGLCVALMYVLVFELRLLL